jgi:hypothetical protein
LAFCFLAVIKGGFMAKPNYQFEKRQKELAKKNKKEEKRRQKVEGALSSAHESADGAAHPVEAVQHDIDGSGKIL